MNREIIMNALFNKLTSAPLVFNFTANTRTGDLAIYNVSDETGLMIGMPVMGDGLAADTTITAIDPAFVSISLPAIANRNASPMTQGFQTASRRLADPSVEQDMPALYLVEVSEMHGARGSDEPTLVEINCEAWIYTRAGADQNAIPVSTLNTLIDGIERAFYPTPTGFWQNLGLRGVAYCRIEGEITKDPGYDGQIAGAIVPIKLVVSQTETTVVMS